ncbi:ethanolamine ammonia-lyase subunit EutC [Clostridium algidicarnis]|uniref:ethanolamine ammonia-lyase subunit EutC n=1 Tax=Clostridium algidicarnis TaxID=37659 RepID=UPI001C0D3C06|nr:ethanolamine ammonia-lyase subunit EutC [Clostridium algidicarnis]MBU3196623.1 ethanolamine ammonia-lyase subunit EutC [Clostridium algidicarnis]
MFSESDLKRLVEQVLVEMTTKEGVSAEGTSKNSGDTVSVIEDGMIPDITEVDLKTNLLVKNPADREGYLKMKKHTSARLGVGRAGARYKTETTLRFRADHAAAQDAVFTDVDEKILEDMNLEIVQTMCSSKDEFITRPDLGRRISKEELDKLKSYKRNPQVQIYISDGLSSKAIEANVKSILPALIQGLEGYGISVGKPFFVKLGRVGAMDVISEEFGADVTCVLIGERPGLVTAESMSAYIAYKGTIGMEESRRTVVSNIHRGGTPAVEAGAYIADIIKLMLEKKASGLDLKL